MRYILLIFVLLLSKPLEAKDSWYTYWGVGGNLLSIYESSKLDQKISNGRSNAKFTARFSMDLLGFYFPVNDELALGFIYNGFVDMWDVEETESFFDRGITSYIFGADRYNISGMYFPMGDFSEGLFLRADLGFSTAALVASKSSETMEDVGHVNIGWGFGGGLSLEDQPFTVSLLYSKFNTRQSSSSILKKEIDFSVGVLQLTVAGLW